MRAVADATDRADRRPAKAARRAAEAVPPLREAEARAAAALQRLLIARDTLDAEETRARERLAELDRRLAQFEEDVARERTLVADAEAALAQLAQEEETLRHEVRASAERRSGVDARAAEADAVVGAAEKTFGELTGALADLTARAQPAHGDRARAVRARRAHGRRDRQHRSRPRRRLREPARSRGARRRGRKRAGRRRPRPSRRRSPPKPRIGAARKNLDAARIPLADAERAVQRLDTEAKTLMKLLAVETKSMWPPVIDKMTVEKGYEIALGAALGDDLDAPVDQSHADALDGRRGRSVRSGAAGRRASRLPSTCRRRRSWRAGSPRSAWSSAPMARALAGLLKPGQRLVSRDGDLWRWDGFAAAAHAPTGAARRLAATQPPLRHR